MVQAEETRSQRRRSRTRESLLTAAGELFSEKGVGNTRIAEITERADVGAGSFYNHFEDKDALVQALLADLAEAHGKEVDSLTADIEDPASVVALAHVHFVRAAVEDPAFGQLVLRLNASHSLLAETLGPRAIRDIEAGRKAARFEVTDPVQAAYVTGGALLGTISGVVDGTLGEPAIELHVTAVLRMLGLPANEAAQVSAAAAGADS